MRKSAKRRPYQPRRLKLATMPWKVDMVFGPIERILHRIEADCTIDMRIAGGHGSGFIPVQSVDRNRPQLPGETYSERTGNGSKTVTTLPGGATVTRHKMGGVNE